MLLVGDIGGTNTRLALFEYQKDFKLLKEQKFLSNDYNSLLSVIHIFLEDENYKVEAASFGVAGPVKKGICQATNFPWLVDSHEIAKDLNIKKVYLINDLEANAYGIPTLKDDELFIVNEGVRDLEGNCCVLAAGTCLGEAGIYFDGKVLRPFSCEGGHTDFGPQNELEIELLRFLKKIYGHVSYARILSGAGIYHLYEFLVQNKIEPSNESLEQELKKSAEPQVIITQKGINKEDRVCERVLDIFCSIYGAEASNAAVKFMALGGVFLGGGIAPKIIDKIKEGTFMKTFVNKGRFTNLMMSTPVKVILNDRCSLLGAHRYAILNKN